MKCPRCSSRLKKEEVGIINYYLITPNKVMFERKEVVCPICGCVLAKKEFNEKV